MTLQEWVDRYNAEHGRGAVTYLFKRTGRTFKTITNILRGVHSPTLLTAIAIEEATDGAVTAQELRAAKPDEEDEPAEDAAE